MSGCCSFLFFVDGCFRFHFRDVTFPLPEEWEQQLSPVAFGNYGIDMPVVLIGKLAVEVEAIDESAKQFYERYGFLALADDPRHLFLPMNVIRKLQLPPLSGPQI